MARVTFFVVPDQGQPVRAPLRLAVPCVPAAEALLLDALRTSAPSGTRETSVELGPEAPEAELALLDYWTEMPVAERDRVWAAAGELAGVLARFDDRPALGFAVVSDDEWQSARPMNSQTRSLLMAAHADTWTLAGDCGPDVDADAWRARLKAVLDTRWSVGYIAQPGDALARLARSWGLDPTRVARCFTPPVEASIERGATGVQRGWLDRELLAAHRAGGDMPAGESPPGLSPPTAQAAVAEADRVVRGRRSRLYLAHDSHDSHRQIIGERPLTPGELDTWEHGTTARMASLAARGCRFVHLIGPAPQVVHADDLPGSLAPSPSRPALQILERLGTRAPILYPLDELLGVRALGAPFSLTDSHWNDLGAFVAYEALLGHLGDGAGVRRVERADVAFQDTVYEGDLGGKLQPERASIFLRARLDVPRARVVEDNRVRNHGRRVVYDCAAAPPRTCVVFGDSWAYPMMLFLAESFRRTVFLHRVNVVDRRPVEEERPDLVLVVMTERFCDAVPNDDGAVDFDQLVAKKVRKRDLVAPQPSGRRYEFLHSLALDRHLRDRDGLRLGASVAPGRLVG